MNGHFIILTVQFVDSHGPSTLDAAHDGSPNTETD